MTVPGNLFVISAPSGAGKTSLVKAIVESVPAITVSISHTTRDKRPEEIDGINYYFIDETEFQRMIQHAEFLEYATIFHHHYGTSHTWVEETLAKGMDVILEIDWQGFQQIKTKFPDCISIFILPPNLSELSARLFKRNQDKLEVIKERLADARDTITHVSEFDYVVINEDFSRAILDLTAIIETGRLLKKRQVEKYAHLLDELKQK
jgi:guanylate kinase